MTIVVSLLGGFLLVAVLLMGVSAVLPDFRVDGFGSALAAAAIAWVLGYAVLFVYPLLLPLLPEGGWIPSAVRYALSGVLLAIAIAFTPGIKAGLLSTLAAAVIVSVAEFAVMSVVVPLIIA